MPTEMEIERATRCEYMTNCCETGHDCEHPRTPRVDRLNTHCEDLVNEDKCPFLVNYTLCSSCGAENYPGSECCIECGIHKEETISTDDVM